MTSVRLALMWHHHQPIYRDPGTAHPAMPWVRLHGIKDYWGMARHLERVPEMRVTVNLVPSLLEQIDAYVGGRAVDPHMAIGRKRVDELSETEILFVLEHFFSVPTETMIEPVSRYRELLEARGPRRLSAKKVRRAFREQDIRDLVILFDLVWFHPFLREEDEGIAQLWAKGRGFSEEDRQLLHERESAVLAQIIPKYRRLAEAGQIELTTSPFYHPILPLLLDFHSVHEAMPSSPVPRSACRLEDDARLQLKRALSSHAERFGSAPRGIWPSEGAVSDAAVALLGEFDIDWIASDQQVLERSTPSPAGAADRPTGPEALYMPYAVARPDGRPLRVVFRDQHLSDLIGFQYRGWEGKAAAEDLVARLRRVGESWRRGEPPVVAIILDGENAWEHYRDQGVRFLEALYRGLTSTGEAVIPLSMADALADIPAAPLGRIHAGSWIDHSFRLWAGHTEHLSAWEEVFRCRRALDAAGVPPESPAREELRIAEGSDWYWWYGDAHPGSHVGEFDRLFRAHVRAAYSLAGLAAPPQIGIPIKGAAHARVSAPNGPLSVTVDGRDTHYFEWSAAGAVEGGGPGAMARGSAGPSRRLLFGCDHQHLYIRLDHGGFSPEVRRELRIVIETPTADQFSVELCRGRRDVVRTRTGERVGEAACLELAEIALSWSRLGLAGGDRVEFYVHELEQGTIVERLPPSGVLSLRVPREDDARWDWSV